VGEQLALLFPLTEGETQANATGATDYSCNHAGSLVLGGDSSHWLVSTSGVEMSGSGSDNRLASTFALDTLLQQAAAASGGVLDGWSAEVWVLPATVDEVNEIMTIGTLEATGTVGQYAPMLPGNSLVLLQNGSSYTFLVQLDSAGGTQYALAANMPTSFNPQPYNVRANEHAFHVLSPDATPVLTQLVLVLNSTMNEMQMFVNGQLATTLVQPFDSPLSSWFTSSSILSFAQTSSSTATAPLTWSGSIRLVAMYSSSLKPADIHNNWIAGTPPDVPQPPANTNVSWSWQQPYFNLNVSTTSPVLVTIRSLPKQGVLAVYNATSNTTTVLTVGQLPVVLNATTVVTFRYWPPSSMNGSYVAEFNYTLALPSAPASPSNPGTVSFVVPVLITPPLPINQSLQAVAQVPLLVQLSGLDEDTTSPTSVMSAAYIVSLPAYGHLLQVNSDGSFGALISSSTLPAIVSDSQLRVWYVSNPGSLTLSSKAVVLPLDTFGFTVEVKDTVSTVGSVVLTISNSMTALNSSTVLYDSNATLVSTQGSDAINETFPYAVLTLPSYGVLLNADNATLGILTPFVPPVSYQSSQQRDSGRYDRMLMPLPDSFTFATVSATGILSVPATVSITFAPTLGPPLLVLNPPFEADRVIVSNPVNFSATIDPTGLSDPLTTVWLVTLNVSPATGRLNTSWTDGMDGLDSSFAMDINEPQTIQFEAVTDDANLLLSHLTFESTIVNTYTVTLTVQNNADHHIQSTASTPVTTIPTLTTASSGNVAGLLPFNALYLWITVAVLVALIIVALVIRRCVSDKDGQPVMTNEERHILNKVRAGAGLAGSGSERLDGGIMRTSSGGGVVVSGEVGSMDGAKVKKGLKSSSEEKEADVEEKQQSVGGLVGFFSGGSRGKRALKLTPNSEESLGMTSVLPQAPEASHLGSRIDTELWGQHAVPHAMLPQPQNRGVQLIPTAGDSGLLSVAAPFDPYATANLVPYEAMQTQPLSITQMLSSSLTDSQLLSLAPVIEQPATARRVPRVLTPTVSADDTPRTVTRVEAGKEEVVAALPSSFHLLHAAYAQPAQRSLTSTSLSAGSGASASAHSSAGLLASPRRNPTEATTSVIPPITTTKKQTGNVWKKAARVERADGGAKWKAAVVRSEEQPPDTSPSSHRRAHTATHVDTKPLQDPMQLEDVDNTPPAAKAATASQPRSAGVVRASTFATGMRRGRLMRPRSKSNAGLEGDEGIEVPVNPMFPVNSDTPRYRPEVYNTATRRRQLSISRGSSSTTSQRDSVSVVRADEDVVDAINRQHPLFEHNRMLSMQQPSVDEEEEL